MYNIDLNSVCRFFEIVAFMVFVFSILIMLVQTFNGNSLEGLFMCLGGIITAGGFMFISKLGDAVDDIRNKYVYND